MPYADYGYYKKEYLVGQDPVIREENFLFWEKQAEREIDEVTFQRLKKDSILVSRAVKDCICAVAEVLYKADQVSSQSWEAGAAGPLTSYSNDGESGTFDLSQSEYTADGKRKKISSLVSSYLGHTGLLYRGQYR